MVLVLFLIFVTIVLLPIYFFTTSLIISKLNSFFLNYTSYTDNLTKTQVNISILLLILFSLFYIFFYLITAIIFPPFNIDIFDNFYVFIITILGYIFLYIFVIYKFFTKVIWISNEWRRNYVIILILWFIPATAIYSLIFLLIIGSAATV